MSYKVYNTLNFKIYYKKMNSIKERRKQILDFIKSKQIVKISDLSDFMIRFNVDQKTISRDLSKLVEEKKLEKKWVLKSTYYEFSNFNKIIEEIDVEKYFQKDYQNRDVLSNFNFEIFDILKNDLFTKEEKEKLDKLQQDFIKNFSSYDSQTLINKEYERIMIEFSWKSSAIEWNTYSLLATEALLKENIADSTKTPEETQMILNHKDSFNEVIQNKDIFHNLKYQDIEYIHQVLMKKLWVAKNIRKSPVWITWTKYKPLDNEFQIKEALQKTAELINTKEYFFEKSFISLILLAYIQAFEDGNKRTSRMLSNAILLAYNSIPLSYRIVDIIEYKKAVIMFYEQNNISYLKKIFIEQFEDSVKNYFN